MTDTMQVRPSDFFTVDVRATVELHGGDPPIYVLDAESLDELRARPSPFVSDLDVAEGLRDLLEDALLGYASRELPPLTGTEMTQAARTLRAVTQRLGIPIELPFRDSTTVETLASLRRHLDEAKANAGLQIREDLITNLRDPAAIREHLARLQRIGIDQSDPALAIGTAKELVENTAKTVLQERGFEVDDKDNLPALVRRAHEALGLHPLAAVPGPWPGPDGTDLDDSGVDRGWLLIVSCRVSAVVSCFRVPGGWRGYPMCFGRHRFRLRRDGPPFRVAGTGWLVRRVRAGRTAVASRLGRRLSRARSG